MNVDPIDLGIGVMSVGTPTGALRRWAIACVGAVTAAVLEYLPGLCVT